GAAVGAGLGAVGVGVGAAAGVGAATGGAVVVVVPPEGPWAASVCKVAVGAFVRTGTVGAGVAATGVAAPADWPTEIWFGAGSPERTVVGGCPAGTCGGTSGTCGDVGPDGARTDAAGAIPCAGGAAGWGIGMCPAGLGGAKMLGAP
ncbi:MAG: hypothetical protein KAZ88_14965, partial [Acidimicrobiia bacterium]|nr:hypothetical protein [Acidimicrobiia bacterium]